MPNDDVYKSTIEDFSGSMYGIDPHAIFARTIKIDGEVGRKFVLNIQLDGPDIVKINMIDTLNAPLMAGCEDDVQLERIQELMVEARVVSAEGNKGRLVFADGKEANFTVEKNFVADLTDAERAELDKYPLARPIAMEGHREHFKSGNYMPWQWTLWSMSENGYEISFDAVPINNGKVTVLEGGLGHMIISPAEPTKPPRNSQFSASKPSDDVR